LVPPPRPKSPSLADLPPGRKQFYLEYVGGASSKFYAVSLEEEDDGTWSVRFNFGRIGYPRKWDARVERVPWPKAANAYMGLIDEKLGKGYEPRPWPAYLKLPDGGTLDSDEWTGSDAGLDRTLFRAATRGTLPSSTGGSVSDVELPEGDLYSPTPEGGSRGDNPVIWASIAPVNGVGQIWARLAAAFPETGVWPLVIDSTYGFAGFHDYLMDMPRGRHTEVATILRRNWGTSVEDFDEDEAPENLEPFGRQFPGLADRTPGDRPISIDSIVATLGGHLGLVAVNRPADILDAVGWMGAANYDFDPLDMSTVLRSWEVRFDAYLVGLGTDTITLAVGRPPRDLASATAIAAEHYAFCLDNIDQGPGSIREYAPLLVNERIWPFWWD
jgi:predicted DNA-binding WGR domain protein